MRLRLQHRLLRWIPMLRLMVLMMRLQRQAVHQQSREGEGEAAAEGGAGEETRQPEALSKAVTTQPTSLHRCLGLQHPPRRLLLRLLLRLLQP